MEYINKIRKRLLTNSQKEIIIRKQQESHKSELKEGRYEN